MSYSTQSCRLAAGASSRLLIWMLLVTVVWGSTSACGLRKKRSTALGQEASGFHVHNEADHASHGATEHLHGFDEPHHTHHHDDHHSAHESGNAVCDSALSGHMEEGPEFDKVRSRIAQNDSAADAYLERLGWLHIEAAQRVEDHERHHLAEQIALCLLERDDTNDGARLLHGHALHQMHRFAESEAVARRLVERRGLPWDHGLLGDTLLEQGDVAAAAASYQRMMDLRPGPEAYIRAAQVRWLTGDGPGAIEMMENAVRSMSPRRAVHLAWALTQLASYRFELGELSLAHTLATRALEVRSDDPDAHTLLARIALAEGDANKAVELARHAVQIETLPLETGCSPKGCGSQGRYRKRALSKTPSPRKLHPEIPAPNLCSWRRENGTPREPSSWHYTSSRIEQMCTRWTQRPGRSSKPDESTRHEATCSAHSHKALSLRDSSCMPACSSSAPMTRVPPERSNGRESRGTHFFPRSVHYSLTLTAPLPKTAERPTGFGSQPDLESVTQVRQASQFIQLSQPGQPGHSDLAASQQPETSKEEGHDLQRPSCISSPNGTCLRCSHPQCSSDLCIQSHGRTADHSRRRGEHYRCVRLRQPA